MSGNAEKFDTDAILEATDLVTLVGRYTELTAKGREYVGKCVNHSPDNHPSMYVVPDKGFVTCFSCGWTVNAITFLQHVEQIDFKESCKRLLNGSGTNNGENKAKKRILKKAPPRRTFAPPADTEPPNMKIKALGEPTATYAYHTETGEILGYVARYADWDTKTMRCWSWGNRSDQDPPKWECGHFAAPRPLYHLHRIAEHPNAQVMLVEGEKTADAAQQLFPAVVAATWPGGAMAINRVDWTILKGRKVVLIPDADEPGRQAMSRIAAYLYENGAIEVKGVDSETLPDGSIAPEGWDLADALQAGWTSDEAMTWAKSRVSVIPAPNPSPTQTQKNTPEPPMDDSDHTGAPPDATSLADVHEDTKATEAHLLTPRHAQDAHVTVSDQPMALATTDKGALLMNLDNAVRAIEITRELAGHIWYDEFLDAILTDWQGGTSKWRDADDVKLCLYLQRHIGLTRISVGQAHDAATIAAFHDTRNECKDWLNGLQWDETERLPYLLSDGFGAQHDAYTQAVGRCWMVSMVARVMQPGCKVDTVPVLEGKQGIGKSSALAIIGGKWFIECHESVMSKDFFGVLDGHMLVEISEMHGFSRSEVERIKGIISCQVDRYRKAYGRNTEDHPRHTVLVGTTNRDDWQRDETGARRFWPVACGDINLHYIEINRDQLFAEAVHRYKTGEKWWDVPTADQAEQTDARRDVDSWEQIIERWLAETARDKVQVGDILEQCLEIETKDHDQMRQKRVGRALRALGWVNKVRRDSDGKNRKVWVKDE